MSLFYENNILKNSNDIEDGEWFLVHVMEGNSLSTAIQENSLNLSGLWLKNAFSYVGVEAGLNSIGSGDGNGIRADGTSSISWNSFAERVNRYSLQKYNSWVNDNKEGLFDVTPYKGYSISDVSWPCWVQLSNEQVDIDTISFDADNNIQATHNHSNSRFESNGWYCVAINSGDSVNSLFKRVNTNGIVDSGNNNGNGGWKMHIMYEANSEGFTGDSNLMKERRGRHGEHFTQENSLTKTLPKHTVYWINLSALNKTN